MRNQARLKMLRAVDRHVDSDAFLKSVQETARLARQSLKTMGDSQIRGLQNVVTSATRFSEILNFVKSQTGRHDQWKELGPELVEQLTLLGDHARDIAPNDTDDADMRGEVRLRLARHWMEGFVAEYLYSDKEGDQKGGAR